MRKNKKLLQLIIRLVEEIEKKQDIFFKDRPFFEDHSIEPVIGKEHTDDEIDEKITNEMAIEEIVKEIEALSL